MNKRQLYRVWRYVRRVHPWYFLILALVSGAICLHALRSNNTEMGRLREAVFVADKNNGDVEGALRALRSYVHGHMNTSLASGPNGPHPPIQLRYTYERLQAAHQESLGQNNGALYGQAQQACEDQGQTVSAQQTINCIQDYAAQHGVQLAEIPDALYKFDFASARWSPDMAGWSLAITVLSMILFVVTAVSRWLMKRYLA